MKIYLTVRTIPMFNRKIIKTVTINTPSAHTCIHDRSLSWLGRSTSIQSDWIKLVFINGPKTSLLVKWYGCVRVVRM